MKVLGTVVVEESKWGGLTMTGLIYSAELQRRILTRLTLAPDGSGYSTSVSDGSDGLLRYDAPHWEYRLNPRRWVRVRFVPETDIFGHPCETVLRVELEASA